MGANEKPATRKKKEFIWWIQDCPIKSQFGNFACLGGKENPIGRDSQPGRDVECVLRDRSHTAGVHIEKHSHVVPDSRQEYGCSRDLGPQIQGVIQWRHVTTGPTTTHRYHLILLAPRCWSSLSQGYCCLPWSGFRGWLDRRTSLMILPDASAWLGTTFSPKNWSDAYLSAFAARPSIAW